MSVVISWGRGGGSAGELPCEGSERCSKVEKRSVAATHILITVDQVLVDVLHAQLGSPVVDVGVNERGEVEQRLAIEFKFVVNKTVSLFGVDSCKRERHGQLK